MTETLTRIPLVDVVAQNREVGERLRDDLDELFRSGAFVNGPQVAAFETDYARYAGRRWCVGVSSGTDAVRLALGAAGVGPGDEVIVPAQTFVATAEAVLHLGAVPVVVDTDPVHHLIDPERVAERIGERTRAIVPVHLFGQMAPMEPLITLARRHDLVIVEDAAQAHGAGQHGRRPGQDTAAAATSFYPGKNLGACGDAGAVLTDDHRIAQRIRAARDHRCPPDRTGAVLVGGNARLDSIQATVLRAKLPRLTAWNTARAAAAQHYVKLLEGLADVQTPSVAPGNVHAWHLFPILVPPRARDRLVEHLHAAGVQCGVHYRQPLHRHPNLGPYRLPAGSCPRAESATARLLSLPLYPHLEPTDQERVVAALADGLAGG